MNPNRFGELVQKAFYLGLGLADYAQEQAGARLTELRQRAQKLADEMVRRGEMNAEEARRFVDNLVHEAQEGAVSTSPTEERRDGEPRKIEIIEDEEELAPPAAKETKETAQAPTEDIEALRQQVEALRAELRRLRGQ